MNMSITLEDNEMYLKPIAIAESITKMVDQEMLTHKDVKEIVAYLSVYTRYNQG